MSDPKYRWLLEHAAEGEVRVLPEATVQGISEALTTPYAALYDTTDEACVWCFGGGDRRIVEIRTFPNGTSPRYGVVAAQKTAASSTTVEAEGQLLEIPSNEVLTEQQAESIFLQFFELKSVPLQFHVIEKSYFMRS